MRSRRSVSDTRSPSRDRRALNAALLMDGRGGCFAKAGWTGLPPWLEVALTTVAELTTSSVKETLLTTTNTTVTVVYVILVLGAGNMALCFMSSRAQRMGSLNRIKARKSFVMCLGREGILRTSECWRERGVGPNSMEKFWRAPCRLLLNLW